MSTRRNNESHSSLLLFFGSFSDAEKATVTNIDPTSELANDFRKICEQKETKEQSQNRLDLLKRKPKA